MRAYHMPSHLGTQIEHIHNDAVPEDKQMKLKILYALDDTNNFLARSPSVVNVKTARIPIPGQQNMMTLGVVSMKDALSPLFKSSPELFSDSVWDYSIYVKDVSEEDEPFVGHGLISKVLNMDPSEFDDEIMIPGRVCSNFAALLSSRGPSETLEIRLKFVKVKRQDQLQQFSFQQEIQTPSQPQQSHTNNTKGRSSVSSVRQGKGQPVNQQQQINSSDTEDEDEDHHEKQDTIGKTFIQPRLMNSSSHLKSNRLVNNNPAPKAARTQSLPVFENMMKPPSGKPIQKFPTDSIARRIYMADKLNGNKIEEKYTNMDNNVAKRFASDFIKINSDNKTEPKKKIRKTSPNTLAKAKTPKPSIPEEHHLYQSCFNCKTMEAKGWKWNESDDLSKRGLLCSLCYSYLKERGIMRPRKLYKKTVRVLPKDKTPKLTPSSPPSSTLGTDLTPGFHNNKNLPSSVSYDNSSDPLNGFEDMVNDLELQFGPLTDIDPLPQPEDKENVPPKTISIARQLQEYHEQKQNNSNSNSPLNLAKNAKNQTAFEKMLTKSFSGVIPTTGGASPNDWMSTLFENAEPTPRDATPKDSPKDITTCNTLPCNEESPESSNEAKEQKKISAVPSSPFLSTENQTSSPVMNNQSEEWLMSDNTKVNSTLEYPSKQLQPQNDQFDTFDLVK